MASLPKPLPDALPAATRRLVERLRDIKDENGLSLAELASRTHYSRASWERWLNGKRLITAQAVDSLAASVDCDAAELRTLLRLAASPEHAPDPAVSARRGSGGAAPVAEARPAQGARSAGPAAQDGPGEPGISVAGTEAADGRPSLPAAPAPVSAAPAPAVSPAGVSPASDTSPAVSPAAAAPAPGVPAVSPAAAAPAASRVSLGALRRKVPRGKGAFLAGAVPVAVGVAAVALVVALRPGGPRGVPAAGPQRPATTSAQPAQLCEAVGCTGKDPQYSGCGADARTLVTGNDGKIILYIRYSPRCRSAWARLTDGAPQDTATILTNTGLRETALIHWGFDAYSPMVDASGRHTTVQVCGHQPEGDACTTVVLDPAAAPPAPSPSPGRGPGTSAGSTPALPAGSPATPGATG